jgi:hypothetical protein
VSKGAKKNDSSHARRLKPERPLAPRRGRRMIPLITSLNRFMVIIFTPYEETLIWRSFRSFSRRPSALTTKHAGAGIIPGGVPGDEV